MAKIFVYSLIILLATGCQTALMKQLPKTDFEEQLYIDAELNFAIKHPLNWKRIKTPVSSPGYRADTVQWQIEDPQQQSSFAGSMLIRSLPSGDKNLPEQLSQFLENRPELQSGQVNSFEHPAGQGLKLLGHDKNHGRLTIALQGQQHDFIIALSCLNNKFDQLLPVFQDIVDSFSEIVRPPRILEK